MNKSFYVILVLFAATSWSQSDKTMINGKITADVSDLEGIYVINQKTEKVIATDKGGYFSLEATAGDSLMFSSVQFVGKRIALTLEDMEKPLFFVRLEAMIHPLDEIKIINYNNINAVALGIIPKGQKSYSPAERKLKTATDMSGGIGYIASADPLINLLSGRTAMLQKEVAVEKKEILIAKIANMFEEKFFIENLQIPELYVRGFLYYIIEDEKFLNLLKSKNKPMTIFFMGELAVKYNEIIARE